jgi:puromycin-sensitive aminopeptidase
MTHPTQDKNFRLSTSLKPTRYQATVSLDLDQKTFQGEQTVALTLATPSDEIVLHAIELTLTSVELTQNGKSVKPVETRKVDESETLVLKFAAPIEAGEASLAVKWTGAYCAGLRGLYKAGPVSVTQFEAADARRLFPCFDEPSFKATWAITLVIPENATALSNGAQVSSKSSNGKATVVFKETPPLSSYLIAIAVGNIVATPAADVRGVPVRTWSTPEKAHLAAFGQDVAVNVLPRLEDYFGIPYAFGKCDQIGIPDFEAGAMENAGLITYREVALLLDPSTASLPVKKRVAEVVTHELAHQWFGNWVTMVWWDDLWLNEAFATWMAYKIVDGWHPEWRVWLDFDNGKAAALHLDALSTTHPVRGEVKNAAEATESFDAITYEKGGAVLRMIENYLGEVPFRDGIRAYMKKFGKSNAVADDLWNALGESSKQPVLELANAWIRQSGYPVVFATVQGDQLTLKQQRFFSEPGKAAADQWPVPMVLRFAGANGQAREQRLLLREKEQTFKLEGLSGAPAWLVANGGNSGFFRVAYSKDGLALLRKNLKALAPAERVSLLADQWALVRADLVAIADFLDLALAYEGESDNAVLDELVGKLGTVDYRLLGESDRSRFAKVVQGLFSKQLAEVGWDAKADEDGPARLRRAALVRALGGIARTPAVVAEATARLDRFWGGDASALENNLQDIAVGLVARDGDAGRFEQFLTRYQAEKDPAFRRRYLMALGAFEDPKLYRRAMELLFSETVPMQDFAGFVSTLLGNRAARDEAWALLTTRWADVEAKTGGAPMLFRRVIEAMGAMPERRHFIEVNVFLQAHPYEAAKAAIAQTLERMKQDVELRERALAPVSAWLAAR